MTGKCKDGPTERCRSVAGFVAAVLGRGAVLGIGVALLNGPAASETLAEALVMTYQTNPTLQAQRATLRATDEGVSQALGGWRPTAEVLGSGGLVTQDARGATEGGGSVSSSGNTYSGSLRLTQNLYTGGGTVADISRAENTVRAERARLAATEQNVFLAAVQAYMDVVRDQAVLGLNQNNEMVLQRQLEATRDRFQVGEVTRTDVAQAEARLSRAAAERIRAEGDLEVSRGIYERIIGKAPGDLVRPDPIPGLPGSRQQALDASRGDNPAVIAAFYDERASRDNVDVAFSDLLPRVDLVGQAGRSRQLTTAGREVTADSASITAQLTIPLYQRGSVSSRVREAKQVVGRNRLVLVDAQRSAMENANSAWERLQTTRAQIKSFEAEVRANKIALEGVRQEAVVGARTVLDVLDAEQELLDSQVSLVSAERDETVAEYDLLSAIGRLTAQDMNLDTELYDPQRHYREVRDKLWGVGESVDQGTERSPMR